MKRIIDDEKKPIKMWLDTIEASALQQARNLANLPFTYKHVALMPDSHPGYGMPIGGVFASTDTIIPNAVGVDIGCGMCSIKTNFEEIEKSDLQKIIAGIKEVVPVGFNWHPKPQNEHLMPIQSDKNEMPVVNEQYVKAQHQLGTLGGGNHFIEIQKGSDGYIWIMIHSGSRNIGKTVADKYNRVAQILNTKWSSPVPKAWQLAYLPIKTDEAIQYFNEMKYCVDFAFANRKLMMANVKKIFSGILHNVSFGEMINIAHNYAAWENHFNRDVIVHRKGATSAYANEVGIIPGSMGTKSYIVEGLGNPESFKSCSHGAGRTMGRKEAQRTLNLKTEIEFLNGQGIIHGIKTAKHLDEAPTAYKNIDEVMRNQSDLVKILIELKPLAVVKG